MLIDHLASFVPNTYAYYIMKCIGRITIVIMCYFVVEGYHKTSNIGKYMMRMGIFAAISQIPFFLYKYCLNFPKTPKGFLFTMFSDRNVIFTLFIGLCLLYIINSDSKVTVKIISAAASLYLVRNSDWGYFAILWIIGFGVFYGQKQKQMLWATAVALLRVLTMCVSVGKNVMAQGTLTYGMLYALIANFGGFFAVPLLSMYNTKKGNAPKFALYIFYPLHLLILAILKTVIF